ncbi:MAG TPA: hypothetical protein VLU38_07070 [Methanomassiliicoccales archaeon]|nr:hypothetical protein [Methanomassiliicoccales archaeon]
MAEKKKGAQEEDEKCTHPLMCAEEWKDPNGAEVIAEYHKDEEELDEASSIERDLDAFESYWQKKQGINFQGEYHKEGAPYMERPSGWDGHRPRGHSQEVAMADEALPAVAQGSASHPKKDEAPIPPIKEPSSAGPASGARPSSVASEPPEAQGKGEPLKLTEVVDINTLEVVSYWIFRLAFGKELHVPIKKEGLADMDVHVQNKDIIVNTNQLYFVFPELVVWHITYTHKGRPILEIGRGVKKGMKVHRFNAFRLLIEVWMGSRRTEKESRKTGQKGAAPKVPEKGPSTKVDQDLREKGDIT